MMHGHEKSGLAIVAENRANVDGRPSAEGGERRAGAKGNTSQTDTRRTPSRASVFPGPASRVGRRIGQSANKVTRQWR